jgi:hypothetical protein
MGSNEVQVLPEAGRPDTTKSLALAGGLSLDEIKSVGTLFFQSGMFKDAKSAAQAITKVIAGQELGVPPMQSMRGIHVVDGNPQLSAGLIAALVKRSGRYDYRVKEQNDTVVVLEWRQAVGWAGRIVTKYEVVGESSFTLAEAESANLTSRTNWKTYTEDMLFARALTRGARRYCPDVFGGAVYAPGEAAPDQEDLPQPFVQATPQGGYTPPRVAPLHDDEVSGESRSASSAHEGAAHTPEGDASNSPSGAPSGTEPHLFPPSEEELAALEADAAKHRDPTDGDA